MASAGSGSEEDFRPRQRRNSMKGKRPEFSELRIVLLGNNWFERSSVGNVLLGENQFNPDREPAGCLNVTGRIKNKDVVLINTPNLVVSKKDLSEHVEQCVRLSAPGPHLFLLVLQPENFTEKDRQTLEAFLEGFSDQAFNHSCVLIIPPKENSPCSMEESMLNPSFNIIIQRCRGKFFNKMHEQNQLLAIIGQMTNEVKEQHVTCRISDTRYAQTLRIVLFGKSEDKKTTLGNIITGKKEFTTSRLFSNKECGVVKGAFNGKPVTVVRTPNLFSFTVENIRKEMQKCVEFCSPGPNVLLLLVKPSEFTDEDRKTLKFILSLFRPDAFKHSVVVLTHDGKDHSPSVDKLIEDCRQRQHRVNLDTNDPSSHEIQQVIEKIEKLVCDNRREYLILNEEDDWMPALNRPRPLLNLVLFGRKGAGKTSVLNAILGKHKFGPKASQSECVRKQGEVCGRWVSVVELPALDGKAHQEVMEKSFRCISLCDPEGVHTFILVLPVGPLTDEDKGELQTIQDTFSSRVNDFIIILFTVDSDPTHPAVVNVVEKDKDIQELCQKCKGGCFVLNIRDRRQIPELINKLERTIIYQNRTSFYTSETFIKNQIERNIQKDERITKLEAEMKKLKRIQLDLSAETDQNSACLRIVLIGKTGSGKSSSGNTILGRKAFQAKTSGKSVTKLCQREECVVDGRRVAVVDTPGLFDDSLSHEEVNDETLKCMSLLAPGPHVFLLVIQIGRLTPEERETVRLIKEGFGKGAERFTIILFTYGDKLENDEQTIEDYIENDNDFIQKLISDCGGRYHVFINRKDQDRSQVRELIRKIDRMVKESGGSFYTNKMLQEAEAAIQKKAEKILKEKEEEMEREKEELKRKYDEEMQEIKRKMEEQNEKLKQEAEEKRKEMKEHIDKERKQREKEQEEREREKRKREMDEGIHQQSLIMQLEMMDKQIQSEKEEKKSVNIELERIRKEKEKEKEAWEKERREWWEKQKEEEEKRKQEEQIKLRELEEQYKKERERYEEERKKEEQIRREQEEKERKNLEEKLEKLQKEYEEKAREEAVRSNEFQEKYKKEFEAQKEELEKKMKDKDEKYDLLKALAAHKETTKRKQYQTEISKLVRCVSKKRENLTAVKDLLTRHEEELKQKETEAEKEEVQKKHETEISELLEKLLKEAGTKSYCCIL